MLRAVVNKFSKRFRFGLYEANRITVIVFTVISIILGIISAVLSRSNFMFYICQRPSFCLPMIPLVMLITISYVCIGASAGIVFSNHDCARETIKYKATLVFVVMMIFNFIWAPIFFLTCNIFVALIDIFITLFFSILLFVYQRAINFSAAFLCGVYLLILLYLTYLNFGFWILN